jgi:hypothetical protein
LATKAVAQDAPQSPLDGAITLRNNRFFTGLLFAFDILIWVMMAACLVEAHRRYDPLPPFDAQVAKGVVIGALWLLISYLCGRYLWEFAMRLKYNHVVLDDTGAHFYMRGNGKVGAFSFSWDEIKSITHRRLTNTHSYTILGTDGESYAVTSYVFWRPGYVARQISMRSGVAIEQG